MRLTTGILLLLLSTTASVAVAASGSVEMRLRALESRMPDADRLAELEKTLGNQGAGILARDVEQLKAELRELRGQIEQLNYQLRKQQEGQQQLYSDIDRRLANLEGRLAGGGATGTPAGGTEAAAIDGVTPTSNNADPEQADYLRAFEQLQQGKTSEAIASFKSFLEKYPDGNYAANAIYWLGESYFLNKNYDLALLEFRKLPQAFPDSPKMPGALLKIGFIHYETRNFVEARSILESVKSRFPDNSVSKLASERLERMRKEGV